jgi:hypothetical protein
MELSGGEEDLLTRYLCPYQALVGDARTGRLLEATVRGIIGAESLCVARIAAFSPGAGRESGG